MSVLKTKNWNYIDNLIYSLESFLHIHQKRILGHTVLHKEEADVEIMIAAETAHLKSENEKLKKLQEPGRITCKDERYYCPHCQGEIHSLLIEKFKIKYCPECGKRIILSIPCDYAALERKN